MPIFREHFDHDHGIPAAETTGIESPSSRPLPIHGLDKMRRQTPSRPMSRRASEESIRTDLCEGPLPDNSQPRSPERKPELDLVTMTTSDRADLIERLKRGESPTWVPNRRLDPYMTPDGSRHHSSSPRPKPEGSPGLLTASLFHEETDGHQLQEAGSPDRMQEGLAIERPRSALHSGDFTPQHAASHRYEDEAEKHGRGMSGEDIFRLDRQSSWFATSPPRHFITPYKFEKRVPFPDLPDGYRSSPPSLSSSLSSSFVYKHPTSPLVQSESNNDLNIDAMDLGPSTPSRAPRRQTLHTSHPYPNSSIISAQRIPNIRREGTFPYQAHQPRKSFTSAPALPWTGSLQTSPSGSRRPSVALDSSPLQQTSMVGSYEESILRGRMSTTPSKPLDFLAQIGVLGLGNCKSSLRCPAHVTLPFPAVFYSYASTPHGRSSSDDGPSPYVGQIDLENGLPNPEDSRARQRSHQRSGSLARSRREGSIGAGLDVEMTGVDISGAPDARRVVKQSRRHGSSPKAPPGGSYRIPEKGQIQIIIKNQNKTAVKLFLVPYDLAGMEPGTKTFIRQRSYSGGPTAPAADAAAAAAAPDDKPVLRYLVHLHICCPARGRYYLYKSVRVVFANRVPDGKEKLRNEITLPEPRWTPYKAVRQMQHAPPPPPPAAAVAAAHQQYHHHMSGGLGHGPTTDQQEGSFGRRSLGLSSRGQAGGALLLPFGLREPPPDLSRARALSVQDRGTMTTTTVVGRSMAGGDGDGDGEGSLLLLQQQRATAAAGFAPLSFAKGGYGGSGGVDVGAGAEGLLSLRLRSLGMQGVCRGEAEAEMDMDASAEGAEKEKR